VVVLQCYSGTAMLQWYCTVLLQWCHSSITVVLRNTSRRVAWSEEPGSVTVVSLQCYSGTAMLQWYCTVLLQWCYSSVTVVLRWCCGTHRGEWPGPRSLEVLQWCYRGVTMVSPLCYSSVTVVLQWCYRGIRVVLRWCHTGVTVVLPCTVAVQSPLVKRKTGRTQSNGYGLRE
jgi:hypothetical protein